MLFAWNSCLAYILAYFICGIPFGLLIAKLKGIDIRSKGSGNIGTTNVARSLGAKFALLTFLFDAGKGFASVYLLSNFVAGLQPSITGPEALPSIAIFFFCVVGHIFSPYLKGKGGKGIAVGVGGAAALNPIVAGTALGLFIVLVACTRIISIGSIAAAISLPLLALLFAAPSLESFALLCLISACVLFAHRENIARLKAGTEKRFKARS